MSAARPPAAAAAPVAFGPNEYENTWQALAAKAQETVFSYWGLGLTAIAATAGACLGLKAAAVTTIVGLIAFGISAYREWCHDQIPAPEQLVDAARQGRGSKVQTLLQCWDSFSFEDVDASQRPLWHALTGAIQKNHQEIAGAILAKVKASSQPHAWSLKNDFITAAGSNKSWVIKLFANTYGTIPPDWRTAALQKALFSEADEAFVAILESGPISELPLIDVCPLATPLSSKKNPLLPRNGHLAQRLEDALLPTVSFAFAEKNCSIEQKMLTIVLYNASRYGRLRSVQTVLNKADTHQDHFVNALYASVQTDNATDTHRAVISFVLNTGRLRDKQVLQKAAYHWGRRPEWISLIEQYAAERSISLT